MPKVYGNCQNDLTVAWQKSFGFIYYKHVHIFFFFSPKIYIQVYIDKCLSVYMYRPVLMHFIQYLYIYMEGKSVSKDTWYIHMCACLHYVHWNVNQSLNIPMTFHGCDSKLKSDKDASPLNKLDLILWKDFNAILWGGEKNGPYIIYWS